jgi:hypothetical protein
MNLLQDIENLPSHRGETLLLLSSPKRIRDSESWTEQLLCMIHAKVLKMVCVDETYFYVTHGLYFRPKLKEILFDKMKTDSNITK